MNLKKLDLIMDWETANHPLKHSQKHELFQLSLEELDDRLHQMAIESHECHYAK